MDQGRMGGPGPTTATPASGRGGPIASAPRVIVVQGERYEVPFDASDEQIAQALGAPPDRIPGLGTPTDQPDALRDIMSDIPSMALGGMGMANTLKGPATSAGKWLLRKAVPALSGHQADIAVRAGAAPLLKSSVKKLAGRGMQTTADTMEAALPTRMAGSVLNDVGVGAAAQAAGLPGWAYTAAKLAGRPLPLSLAAQGIAKMGGTAGKAGGAAMGGLAQEALLKLFGGGS
jgi:hypothetical protein